MLWGLSVKRPYTNKGKGSSRAKAPQCVHLFKGMKGVRTQGQVVSHAQYSVRRQKSGDRSENNAESVCTQVCSMGDVNRHAMVPVTFRSGFVPNATGSSFIHFNPV